MSLCIDIASDFDKLHFPSEGEADTITLPPPKEVTLSVQQSSKRSHPHLDPTIQEPELIAEHNVPPPVHIPVEMFQHQVLNGLMLKGSHGRPPGSPMRLEID